MCIAFDILGLLPIKEKLEISIMTYRILRRKIDASIALCVVYCVINWQGNKESLENLSIIKILKFIIVRMPC